MPARTDAIAAHARTLGADADALTGCATRLRDLAAHLRTEEAAPPWLFDVLNAHITACVVASSDLTAAARCFSASSAAADAGRPPSTDDAAIAASLSTRLAARLAIGLSKARNRLRTRSQR